MPRFFKKANLGEDFKMPITSKLYDWAEILPIVIKNFNIKHSKSQIFTFNYNMCHFINQATAAAEMLLILKRNWLSLLLI